MRLYKYLHPDRISVLRDGMIRFSSPKVLNDPFELKPHVSAIATKQYLDAEIDRSLPKVLAEEYSNLPLQFRKRVSLQQFQTLAKTHFPTAKSRVEEFADRASSMVQQLMAQKFEEMIGVLCLTESPANLLMWAHYADSHQGFVVEFDSDAPFFDQRKGPDDEFRHLRKVIYSDRRPSLILSESDTFSPFLTKGPDWSYEAEWRMMLPLFEANHVIGEGPTGVHLFEYPRTVIRAVILGCRMTEETKRGITNVLQTVDELKNVQCYQTAIDEEHYRLQLSPVSDRGHR